MLPIQVPVNSRRSYFASSFANLWCSGHCSEEGQLKECCPVNKVAEGPLLHFPPGDDVRV